MYIVWQFSFYYEHIFSKKQVFVNLIYYILCTIKTTSYILAYYHYHKYLNLYVMPIKTNIGNKKHHCYNTNYINFII